MANSKINNYGALLFHPKIRPVLYFLAIFLCYSRHWFKVYGLFRIHETISLLFSTEHAISFAQHKSIIDFFGWCILRPIVLTLFVAILDKAIFKQIHSFRQITVKVFKYSPIALIIYGLARFRFQDSTIDWILIIAAFSIFFLLNLQVLIEQWKKSIVYFFGLLLIGFTLWTKIYFGDCSIDQLLSTMVFSLSGTFSVSQELAQSLQKYTIIYPLTITILILIFEKWLQSRSKTYLISTGRLSTFFGIFLIMSGIFGIGNQYHVIEFLEMYNNSNDNMDDVFAKNYIKPSSREFQTSDKAKNLILIYVESLESTYQDPQVFGHNLLNSLTNIDIPNISFKKYKQTHGANWTIGGIVATHCGIPLKLTNLFKKNQIGENIKQFLPRATCLGDILAQQGYHNIFINGPSVEFAGVGTFFKTHHYEEIIGKDQWLQNGFGIFDMLGWGLPDDLLFQQAKIKLKQLIEKQEPFNLTILTIDTHGPNGQINKTCHAKQAKNFENIVECTADEIADFIHFVKQEGWMDKVTIVITGDHLAMKNPVLSKLKSAPERYVFNMIITEDPLVKNREAIFHVDLFPTILNALGFTWSGNKLGLGYSAISPIAPKLSSSKRFNTIEKVVSSRSMSYDNLWISQKQ